MKTWAWKQILITFAISFVLGSVATQWRLAHKTHKGWKDPEARHQWIMKRLDKGLNLTTDQETQISVILKHHAPEMEAVRAKMRPEMEAARNKIRLDIMPVLTHEQRLKYDKMEQEWQEKKKKFTSTPSST